MCVRPRPEMRSPGGRQTTRANSQKIIKSNSEATYAPLEFQAQRLQRIYAFCHDTAVTVARLAFTVMR